MPQLDVFKDGALVETVELSASKRVYKVGRQADVADIVLSHGSISREQATLTVSASGSVTVIDLASAHGTSISGKKLEPHKPHRLPPGRSLGFGQSTRVFKLREASSGFVNAGGPRPEIAAVAPLSNGTIAADDPRYQAVLHVLRNDSAVLRPDGYVRVSSLLECPAIARTGISAADLAAMPNALGDGVAEATTESAGVVLLRALTGHAEEARVDVNLRLAPLVDVAGLPDRLVFCATFREWNALRTHGAGAGREVPARPLRLSRTVPASGWKAPSLGQRAPDLLVHVSTASLAAAAADGAVWLYQVVGEEEQEAEEEAGGLESIVCVGDARGGCLGPWHFARVVNARDGSEMMGEDEIAALRAERASTAERDAAATRARAEAAEATRRQREAQRQQLLAKRRRQEEEEEEEDGDGGGGDGGGGKRHNPYLAHRE